MFIAPLNYQAQGLENSPFANPYLTNSVIQKEDHTAIHSNTNSKKKFKETSEFQSPNPSYIQESLHYYTLHTGKNTSQNLQNSTYPTQFQMLQVSQYIAEYPRTHNFSDLFQI